MNTKQPLRAALDRALARRTGLDVVDFCLVNGSGDDLADLVIHSYGGHVFLQTFSQSRDNDIPALQDWLCERLKPQSIWLKNNTPVRQKRGLVLRDALLHGVDAQTLTVENRFVYSTAQTQLFPLHERWVRTQCQKAFPPKSALLVTPEAESPLWEAQLFPRLQTVTVTAPHWTQLCENLRALAEPFEIALLKMPFLIVSEKNKKALFHVFFNFLNRLQGGCLFFLRLEARSDWALDLLSRAGQATKSRVRFLKNQQGEHDFLEDFTLKNQGLERWWAFYRD